jgi:hypothetical protein
MSKRELKKLKRKSKRERIVLEFQFHKKFLTNKEIARRRRFKYFFMQVLFRRCDGKNQMCLGGRAYFAGTNTAYVDKLSNFQFCCSDCHDEINAYYDELWAEYYSGRI